MGQIHRHNLTGYATRKRHKLEVYATDGTNFREKTLHTSLESQFQLRTFLIDICLFLKEQRNEVSLIDNFHRTK